MAHTKMKGKKLVRSYKNYLRLKVDKEQLDNLGIKVLADGYLDGYYLVVYKQDDRLWLINQVFNKGGMVND